MANTTPIDVSKILALKEKSGPSRFLIPPTLGPIKVVKEHRCTFRGCTAPTHYKFNSIPYCEPHVIQKLVNEYLELKGVVLPDATTVPNGGRYGSTYLVEITNDKATTKIEVDSWIKAPNIYVSECIMYIERHNWDTAFMVSSNGVRYRVIRKAKIIYGNSD